MVETYQFFLSEACSLVSIRESIVQIEHITRKEQYALQQKINKLYKEAEKFSLLDGQQMFNNPEAAIGMEQKQ